MDTTDLYKTLTSVTINSISGGWGPEWIPRCLYFKQTWILILY